MAGVTGPGHDGNPAIITGKAICYADWQVVLTGL